MSSNIPTGKGYSRLAAFPLDESSLFETLAAAEEYAENSPIAYQTQIIGVLEKDMVYMIAADKSLLPLISRGTPIDPDEIDAGKIVLGEAVTLLGTALGGIPDGATITEETTLLEFIQLMAVKRIPPVFDYLPDSLRILRRIVRTPDGTEIPYRVYLSRRYNTLTRYHFLFTH